jgi:hypothetical protein
MKNLILIIIVLAPFSLFAQTKVESGSTTAGEQTDLWMNKISSDSEMRSSIMSMMMVKTSGNKEEMMKLVNTILDNPEMNKMIISEINAKKGNEGGSLEPDARGTMNESDNTKEMTKIKPVPKK